MPGGCADTFAVTGGAEIPVDSGRAQNAGTVQGGANGESAAGCASGERRRPDRMEGPRLWEAQTDEGELGAPYETIDAVLRGLRWTTAHRRPRLG